MKWHCGIAIAQLRYGCYHVPDPPTSSGNWAYRHWLHRGSLVPANTVATPE